MWAKVKEFVSQRNAFSASRIEGIFVQTQDAYTIYHTLFADSKPVDGTIDL
jgi:hypothetical protein